MNYVKVSGCTQHYKVYAGPHWSTTKISLPSMSLKKKRKKKYGNFQFQLSSQN